VSDRRSPWAALGVADGADLDTCAAAFRARLVDVAPRLIGAHAEDRPSDIAAWAELVEAWRAVTAGP
jgi:acetolactate synthase small subunit